MLEARAVVKSSTGGVALVEAEQKSGCGNCDPVKGCGKANLSKLFCSKSRVFEVIDSLGTSPGDEVLIGVKEGAILAGSTAVYLVPLLLLFMGAMLGNLRGDAFAVLGAAAGLLAGFIWTRRYSAKNRENIRFQPYIVRKL